jgi:hypothetical protein
MQTKYQYTYKFLFFFLKDNSLKKWLSRTEAKCMQATPDYRVPESKKGRREKKKKSCNGEGL